MIWLNEPQGRLRDEAHFGNRIVRCFADRPAHVDAMLKRSVAAGPDREALVCGDLRWTYAQLDAAVEAEARARANYLAQKGRGKGRGKQGGKGTGGTGGKGKGGKGTGGKKGGTGAFTIFGRRTLSPNQRAAMIAGL